MTRERVIRLAERWSEGGVCTLREGEAQEYHKTCLAALREQEEYEGFCPNCGSQNECADMREITHD